MNRTLVRGAPLFVLGFGLMASACESLHLYEGARRPVKELAQIAGHMRISGSLPVTVALRRIDDEDLGVRYRGAYVEPGDHDLLIDCTVTESKHTSRHHLSVTVDAGVKYRLVGNTGPGNSRCESVQLQAFY